MSGELQNVFLPKLSSLNTHRRPSICSGWILSHRQIWRGSMLCLQKYFEEPPVANRSFFVEHAQVSIVFASRINLIKYPKRLARNEIIHCCKIISKVLIDLTHARLSEYSRSWVCYRRKSVTLSLKHIVCALEFYRVNPNFGKIFSNFEVLRDGCVLTNKFETKMIGNF